MTEENIIDYSQQLCDAFWGDKMWSFELGDCAVIYRGDDLIVCEGVDNPKHCGYRENGCRHATAVFPGSEFPTLFWSKPMVSGGKNPNTGGK